MRINSIYSANTYQKLTIPGTILGYEWFGVCFFNLSNANNKYNIFIYTSLSTLILRGRTKIFNIIYLAIYYVNL